jgi:hypothetical protein
MRPFAVLDSETDPFKRGRVPCPFVWGYYDGHEFIHYLHDTLDSLIDYISKQKIVIYAHNGGKFDYHFLLHYLESYDSIKIINGRIASFKIGKAEFRDSMNILPVALSKMSIVDSHGKTIKKQEFDYALMEKDKRFAPDTFDKIIDYLRDDCVTLYEMINAFQSEYGRHLTIAGAAMKQWKKISNVDVPKSTPGFFSYISPYYFGGRVQCFKHGIVEKDFSVFDINSAYPAAMLNAHPYGLDYVESQNEDENEPRGPGFFTIEANATGAFPVRSKNGLGFPNTGERMIFNVTGWELQAAIDTATAGDYVVKKAIYFHHRRDFSIYVDNFYRKRLEAKASNDSAGDLFAKLFMNSLYGKFGANPENYADYIILPPSELDSLNEADSDYSLSGDLGPWLLAERPLDDDEMRYYNVATAASITGYVRAVLWKSICATGIDNMLYCDTDSIATHDEGHGLQVSKALGDWKHEGEFDKAGIGGKKLYIFRGKKPRSGNREYKTASKGARLTHAQLWKVARGEEVLYEPENPTFSVHHGPRFVARKIRLI